MLEGILKGIPKMDEPILFTAVALGTYSVPSNLVKQDAEKYFTVQKLFLDHTLQYKNYSWTIHSKFCIQQTVFLTFFMFSQIEIHDMRKFRVL
jgi:hypothetical protein